MKKTKYRGMEKTAFLKMVAAEGGKAKVKKGLGSLSPERRSEISRLGGSADKTLKEWKRNDTPETVS